MTVYLSIDDTDMPETRGTGKLARDIASYLSDTYPILGITRHQLYVHPDIPYTSHNSAAVIHLNSIPEDDLDFIFQEVQSIVREQSACGSDPGVCMAEEKQINPSVILFGKDAKNTILTQKQAIALASHSRIRLAGLGGTNGGIIGALAAIGLAASGSDGRYIQVGTIRNLHGEADVAEIHAAGIETIITADGRNVMTGRCMFRKFPQPVRIKGTPVLLVSGQENNWVVERRD